MASWTWASVPIGPQQLPPWARGLHIEWFDQYCNPPSCVLKTDREITQWPDKLWEDEGGGYYRARHDDGRLDQLVHKGHLTWDGATGAYLTTKQQGFAGSSFEIRLRDGRRVVLRGPWATSMPDGFSEVSHVDPKASWRGRRPASGHGSKTMRWHRPWWNRTAIGGVAISNDLLIRLLARFQPHLRIALVTRYGQVRAEPLKPEWSAPKGLTEEDFHAACGPCSAAPLKTHMEEVPL